MTLLADRFLRHSDSWFDIATAEPVIVSIQDAGPLREQIVWAERCAMLVRLRHPLLNPLIDFGVADRSSFFEAYAIGSPLLVSPYSAACLVTHLGRFLEGHGVRLTRAAAVAMLRTMRRAVSAMRLRPLGVVLQPRRQCDAVVDLLGGTPRGGVTAVQIAGPPGSGLRTFATIVAHLARREGYVPVCGRALLRWPHLLDELSGRHVCLITHSGQAVAEHSAAAVLLARLALRSARPHLCLSLRRGDGREDGSITLDALGMTTMTTMTYIDPDFGPSASELFDAARKARGMPGPFLTELAGKAFAATSPHDLSVHETTADYGTASVAPRSSTPRSTSRARVGSILWRAGTRASSLEGRGRHAAAARLLTRAARVLEGRGDVSQAARCWLQLAWMARNRGALAGAQAHAERARQTDPSPENQVSAACAIAVCWTDESRLIEAEASLRNLIAAAAELDRVAIRDRCMLALGRAMYWQGRSAEVLRTIDPVLASTDPDIVGQSRLLSSRARRATGDLPGALHAAREASKRAGELNDLRLRAAASLVMAEALGTAGDIDGVRAHVTEGLDVARAAHLPLMVLRLRAVMLEALRGNDDCAAEAQRIRLSLERALRRAIPPLLAKRLTSACRVQTQGDDRSPSTQSAAAHLEAFLDIAQRSKDDVGAVQDVIAALCERVGAVSVVLASASDRRVVVTAGRAWREGSALAGQAIMSGRSVPLDRARQPPEAAEPVRCGGELIGAVACRWLIQAALSPVDVAATLRTAALAAATHLRAVVDRPVADVPPAVWGDLLGESAGAGALRAAIQRASRAPFPVLIEGESGSGKELVARAIHKLSTRHTRRFCAINCAALSDDLVEAELFGHARGAFTGATTERAGLFEEADGGTLFLDEIGELSARAQAKLLRVLQEGEVRRVGENMPRRVDVRIVAATNRRLEHEASHGRFRQDLRFRLDVLRIVVPPLRERIGDIPILARHLWHQACERVGSSATLGPDALAALSQYDWPGNVRELQNAIAWMAVHAPRRGRVSAAMLPSQLAASPVATGSFEAAREDFERRFVRAALAQAGGQRQVAARALGITRQGLAKMLRRLGIEPDGTA